MRVLVLFVGIMLGGMCSAWATTVLRVPLEEMARGSDVIVHARVEAVSMAAQPDDERDIRTTVRLSVIRVLKGHPTGPRLTLVLPGGQTGRWTLLIPGMPKFRQGEEVVLFLEMTSAGLRPAGLSLGTYHVVRDASTGRARVVRHLDGLSVVERTSLGVRSEDSWPVSHADDEMDLEVLLLRVQNALKGEKP